MTILCKPAFLHKFFALADAEVGKKQIDPTDHKLWPLPFYENSPLMSVSSASVCFCFAVINFGSSFLKERLMYFLNKPLADLGGVPGARPLWDPILSFLHTFSPKSAHIGGPCPPNGCMPPYGKSWIHHCKLFVKQVKSFCLLFD